MSFGSKREPYRTPAELLQSSCGAGLQQRDDGGTRREGVVLVVLGMALVVPEVVLL